MCHLIPANVMEERHGAGRRDYQAICCAGAKLFYLSGIRNGKYLQREVLNLARFISVMKFRPLSWRLTHPYLLTDRFEVLSPAFVGHFNKRFNHKLKLISNGPSLGAIMIEAPY